MVRRKRLPATCSGSVQTLPIVNTSSPMSVPSPPEHATYSARAINR
ncbi:MAG: hypothetical protein ABSB24_03780 [Gaiellaceae bacterium]|jgi:hypothetical protein